jgi:hypothetical protein
VKFVKDEFKDETDAIAKTAVTLDRASHAFSSALVICCQQPRDDEATFAKV